MEKLPQNLKMATPADTPVDDFEYICILKNDVFFCRQWKIFCGLLKFQNDTIHDLKRMEDNGRPMSEIILNILQHWIAIASKEANSQNLAIKLRQIECNTSAEKVEKHCEMSKRYPQNQETSSVDIFEKQLRTTCLQNPEKQLSVNPNMEKDIARSEFSTDAQLVDTLDTSIKCMEELLRKEDFPYDQLINCQMIWQQATAYPKVVEKYGVFPVWICKKIYNSGRYREALDFTSEVINSLENHLGGNNRWTLQMKSWRGSLLKKMGNYNDALLLLKEVYASQLLEKFNVDSSLTARSIGIVYYSMGNLDEALEWYNKALETALKIHGVEHSETLLIKNNMGMVLEKQGKYSEAGELYKYVLGVSERVLGQEHCHTLDTRQNLAALNLAKGSHDEASQMLNKDLKLKEKVSGVDNRKTLNTKSGIAKCCPEFGVEHLKTLKTKKAIASSYHSLGRDEEALQFYNEILEVEEQSLGEEHPETLTTKHLIAYSLNNLERYEESYELYKEVLSARNNVLGPLHPNTLATKHNFAAVLFKRKKCKEALKMFKEVLEIEENVLGANHADTLTTRDWIADCLWELGRNEEALALALEVHDLGVKALGPQHPQTIYSLEVVNRFIV